MSHEEGKHLGNSSKIHMHIHCILTCVCNGHATVVVNCAWLAIHLASEGKTLLLNTLTQILKKECSVYNGSINHDPVPEIRDNAIKVNVAFPCYLF